MPTAHVNGIELYYELHGDGPPVVVIPGLGCDVRMFSPLVTALAERCRVVVFDPRGAGRSDKPNLPYSIDEMADDAAALLHLVGMHSATVIGYSMGGRIALSLALRRPTYVGRLLLASTSARTPPNSGLSWRWFVMDVLGRIPLPRFIDPQPRYSEDRQRQASREFDCTAQLAEISVPTVVIHARHDGITPLNLALELQEGIPGARLVTVKGGHMSMLTTQRSRLIGTALALAEEAR